MATTPKYPPLPHPVTSSNRLIERPWALFFQSLVNQAAAAGDVVGPASSLNGQIALFDGTTGKRLTGATGTGVVHASAGVYSVSSVQLTGGAEVTGRLPYANLTAATAASLLLGRGSAAGAGDWQEITLGSGVSMSGTVLSATGSGGTVTAVTATSPVTSSGGTTPDIALADSGVTAATYGDATHVAQITVSAKGLISAAANVAISGGISADYVVMSDGHNTPTPMDDGAGNFLYVGYTP